MTYTVVFSGPAEADLFAIYDYITERAGGAAGLTHRGLPPAPAKRNGDQTRP